MSADSTFGCTECQQVTSGRCWRHGGVIIMRGETRIVVPLEAANRLAALTAFAQELADEPCHYGDNCPTFGTRHGRCLNCKARVALGRRAPAYR